MCGRYTLLSQPDCRELERILEAVDEAYRDKGISVKRGEIYPAGAAPVLLTPGEREEDAGGALTIAGDVRVKGALMVWGFPRPDFSSPIPIERFEQSDLPQKTIGSRSKGVVINARGETVQEKAMFRRSFEQRRCVIPAGGFFEWSGKGAGKGKGAKEKYLFRETPGEPLYMAGIYNRFGAERRFVILTTAANKSMRDIHDRMPIILPGGQLEKWLKEERFAAALLRDIPPKLQREKVEEDGPRQLEWQLKSQ